MREVERVKGVDAVENEGGRTVSRLSLGCEGLKSGPLTLNRCSMHRASAH